MVVEQKVSQEESGVCKERVHRIDLLSCSKPCYACVLPHDASCAVGAFLLSASGVAYDVLLCVEWSVLSLREKAADLQRNIDHHQRLEIRPWCPLVKVVIPIYSNITFLFKQLSH